MQAARSTWSFHCGVGFYAGSDGYYLVEGQTNNKENDSAEVIRVIRYDTNWNRNGAAAITSNPELFGR